jgi:hypothetical protein
MEVGVDPEDENHEIYQTHEREFFRIVRVFRGFFLMNFDAGDYYCQTVSGAVSSRPK